VIKRWKKMINGGFLEANGALILEKRMGMLIR
jgi:hypothetical protein